MVKNPQNRLDAVRPVIEKLGGWLAFGEYDIVSICQMPNNISAAAFSMAASGWWRCENGQDHAADDDR